MSIARCSGFDLLGFGQAGPTPSVRYWRWYQEYKRGGFDKWFVAVRLLADEFCRNSPLSSADNYSAMVVTGSILAAAPQRREGRDCWRGFLPHGDWLTHFAPVQQQRVSVAIDRVCLEPPLARLADLAIIVTCVDLDDGTSKMKFRSQRSWQGINNLAIALISFSRLMSQ